MPRIGMNFLVGSYEVALKGGSTSPRSGLVQHGLDILMVVLFYDHFKYEIDLYDPNAN